jgi:pilus assembly protein CpaB
VQTVLQDIKVFAVDTVFVGKSDKDEQAAAAKTVTLEVTPSQAEKVTLATEMGNIRLVLRGTDDGTETVGDGTTVARLFGGGDKSDREAERGGDKETNKEASTAKSLLDLLSAQQPETSTTTAPASSGPWKMVILRGSELNEVEFASDSSIARDLYKDNATSGLPVRLPPEIEAARAEAAQSGTSEGPTAPHD